MKILSVGSSVMDDRDNMYILEEIIGYGGFGYVFKAHREKDNAIFAIKTMIPSFTDPSYVLSFKNEIQSAAMVSGDNVIQYEFVNDGDTFPDFPPYIIMEYADGGSLTDVLKKRTQSENFFTNEELITIFKQLSNGMLQINSSLVHRDIKPDNILLCGNTLKISDFGLSKIAAENTRTQSFKGGGTFPFMAPEAFDYSKNTIQMDIYSMGIVFYELATLKYPYSITSQSYEEYKNVHLYSTINNPSQINQKLSPSLVSIINRMLEKPLKKRFSNWNEVINLLDIQSTPPSPMDDLVAKAISVKNAEDIARWEHDSALKRQQKEKEDFLKLVYSQFKQAIITPIIEFAEKVNSQYAGENKLIFPRKQHVSPNQTEFTWELNLPPDNSVTISFEIVLKENFSRVIKDNDYSYFSTTKRENYIPQYKNKNILAWGEITNAFNYGFNILLLDNGEMYGDWIIMNNKNNLSYLSGGERKEPFAFTIDDLPQEINQAQAMHRFRSDFEEFCETSFLNQIKLLSFNLKF